MQLSLPNSLKPGVKSRMKMWLEQRRNLSIIIMIIAIANANDIVYLNMQQV